LKKTGRMSDGISSK